MIPLADPHLTEADIQAVVKVLRSGQLVQGRCVLAFEAAIAERLGCRHAVAVSSGTAGLHLALLALGIGSGDEVLVPDFTFPASVNAVILAGATPVLVDIDPHTYCIDPVDMLRKSSPRTRAVLPVHLFGCPADMPTISGIAKEHGWLVIEDAACALGATCVGNPCGTLGEIGVFSFHPRKVVATGEGGVLTTNRDDLAHTLRLLRNHGMEPEGGKTVFRCAGYNYRMTEMQAALGVSQMARLDGILADRRRLAAMYMSHLQGVNSVVLPQIPAGFESVFQAFVVRLDPDIDRDGVIRELHSHGIQSQIGTYACSQQPAYASFSGVCPEAAAAWQQTLALPLYPGMRDADVERVAECLTSILARQ